MTTFTASAARELAVTMGAMNLPTTRDMLRAYADRLEADERAVPFGYFGWREQKHMDADGHCTVSRKAFSELEVTTPVYTHPAPAAQQYALAVGRAEKAEAELAALKARIAKAPEWYDHPDCVGISASGVMVGLHGKRVRLVVEE